MAFNGSELLDQPWETLFSVFTDILGYAFYLIPISFIAIALYIKTKTVAVSGIWMLATTLMIGSIIFTQFPVMGLIYYIIAGVSFTGIIASIYLEVK